MSVQHESYIDSPRTGLPMLSSYIGRLVLIYGFVMTLIACVVYVYYDDWIGQQFYDLQTVVDPHVFEAQQENARVLGNPSARDPKSELTPQPKIIEVTPNQVVSRAAVSDLLIAGGLLLLLGFSATTLIAWKIHHRLQTINKTADHIIASHDLSRRIPQSTGGNEFDRLVWNLNRMLETIEARVEDIQQLSNNISHDLRTPLVTLRHRLESIEIDYPERDGLTQWVDHLLDTFDAIQRITRLSTESASVTVQDADLTIIVRDVIELYEPLAEEKEQTISQCLEFTVVQADIHLLFQAIANLLENAIKYTPASGSILVRAHAVETGVEIAIEDNGPGIPEDRLGDVADRFVRLEQPEERPGMGLGLSMVRAIAEIHQGQLHLRNVPHGFVAAIGLPVNAALASNQ